MPTRNRDLFLTLFTLLVLLSVSSLATQLPNNSQGIPNQNRDKGNLNQADSPVRDTLNKVLEGMKEETAAKQSSDQSAKGDLRSEIRSDFQNSLRQSFGPDKVVMTCDAVEQLQAFAVNAVDKSTDTTFGVMASGDKSAAERSVVIAQERFKKFLHEQIKAGEQLKDGHVLITGKSFKETKLKWCPLIPIC